MAYQDDYKSIDDLLMHANPNPGRRGCPSYEELTALALRQRRADDPLYTHVSECSPCYADLRELQLTRDVRPERGPKGRWSLWAAAAILCVISGSIWFFSSANSNSAPAIVTKSHSVVPSTVLDLRPFAVSRSEKAASPSGSLALSRSVQNVVLVLPVASAEGQYSLRLLDANLAPCLTSDANATLENGDTRIKIELDLNDIRVGRYTLAIRREPEDWRYFPVEIR